MPIKNNPNVLKVTLISIAALIVVCYAARFVYRKHYEYYPHGMRSGKLTTYMGTLSSYAEDHDGWYPKDGATPLESLQKLYPKYDAAGLAGMSGDESAVVKCLKSGKALTGGLSSWVYVPGFRNNDPEVCIIWEREEGIFINGSRADGHAVGFVSGGYDQIPSKDWRAFLKQQEELRQKILSSRTNAVGDPKLQPY